jgi:hypothetical protein
MVHCASLFAPDGDGSLDKNGNITKIGTQIWIHNMEDAVGLSGARILVAVYSRSVRHFADVLSLLGERLEVLHVL